MTVRQLIEKLSQCPDDAAVFVRVGPFNEVVDIERVHPACVQRRNTDLLGSRWKTDLDFPDPLPMPETQERRVAVELSEHPEELI